MTAKRTAFSVSVETLSMMKQT